MKSRFLFLAAGALLAAMLATPTPALAHPASAPTRLGALPSGVAARTAASYAKAASVSVNRQRAAHDRRKLKLQSCLVAQAQSRAAAMARTGRLVHAALAPVQSACGMGRVGENIAFGFATGRSVVDDGWMTSALHRTNLLSKGYTLMGVAAVSTPTGWYVALVLGHG